MVSYNTILVAVFLLGTVLVGVATPVAGHDTQTVDGYEITVGGAAEPLITGERMWVELEVVDNETGAPVEGQAETLEMYVQTAGRDRAELEVSEKHGENGTYEAPVIVTEPGDYVVHVEGQIEGTDVHAHFETTVQDRTELEYPSNGSQTADDLADDGNEAQIGTSQIEGTGGGSSSSLVPAAAIAGVGTLGALAVRRRR